MTVPLTVHMALICGQFKTKTRNSNSKRFEGKLDLEIDKQVRFLSLAPPSGQSEIFQVKSYFGGFLCCAWSPSGRFLAVGGEDDLITVMSPDSGKIICRCQGHRPGFMNDLLNTNYESKSMTHLRRCLVTVMHHGDPRGVTLRHGSNSGRSVICLDGVTGGDPPCQNVTRYPIGTVTPRL